MKITPKARKVLRAKMERLFWTQAQLAAVAGLSEPTVSYALNSGKAHPRNFQKLCKALGLRAEDLMPNSTGAMPDA